MIRGPSQIILACFCFLLFPVSPLARFRVEKNRQMADVTLSKSTMQWFDELLQEILHHNTHLCEY